MRPITEQSQVNRYIDLVREMTTIDTEERTGLRPEWVHARGWKVVPVEDSGHLGDAEITVVLSALNRAGFTECVAVASENAYPAPACYQVALSENGLQQFNKECGLFRYLLTDESRTWVISCDIWYNLYAGAPELLTEMLGTSIEQARKDFLRYASLFKGGANPDGSILRIARHYSSL